MKSPISIVLFLLAFPILLIGQSEITDLKEFILTGDAKKAGSQCFELTPATIWKGGAVWYRNQIDLNESFSMELELYFGCDDYGADGIVFIFHPILQTGFQGEGMGFGGLRPSLGIEMDTYQNFHLNDPEYDHVALMINGNPYHGSALTEPIPLIPSKANVENCAAHKVKVEWNPATKILNFHFGESNRISQRVDLIKTIFGGDSKVYWGFTSATGGEHNRHQVCITKSDFLEVASFSYQTKQAILASERYRLKEVTFDENDKLTPTELSELNNLIRLMNSYPEYYLVIEGHTDDSGSKAANLAKSQKRTQSIADYLESKGISNDRLKILGLGEDYPLKPNKSPANRLLNNRIEVSMQLKRA